MIAFFLVLIFLGMVFGSFVSAISWRIPRSIPFVIGRSLCPNCKHQIAWYDNIPLFSYIILGGKCRNCKKKISLRYPLIELSSAIGFVIIFLLTLMGVTLQGVFSIVELIFILTVFIILLTIFVIDLEHQIIPDSLVATGIIILVSYSLVFAPNTLPASIFSGLLASTFLLIIHLLTKGRGMGLGDVKFAILGGMIVGLKILPIWLLLAFLTGAAAGIILILFGKAKMKSKIAFGPFLIAGIALSLVFGEKIIKLLGLI